MQQQCSLGQMNLDRDSATLLMATDVLSAHVPERPLNVTSALAAHAPKRALSVTNSLSAHARNRALSGCHGGVNGVQNWLWLQESIVGCNSSKTF